MHLVLRFPVAQPPAQVMAGFTRELFVTLAPPFPKLHLLRYDGNNRGDTVIIELQAGPKRWRWTSLITDNGTLPDGTLYFVDEGQILPAPLRRWRHRHLIEPAPGVGAASSWRISPSAPAAAGSTGSFGRPCGRSSSCAGRCIENIW
ncbi:MAG: hypothetical protein WKG07_23260 [Hymenobacter sp.]